MKSDKPIVPNIKIVKANKIKISPMGGISTIKFCTSLARAGIALIVRRGLKILIILITETLLLEFH